MRNMYQLPTHSILTTEKADDEDLVIDCRVNNDRVKDTKFDPFRADLAKYLEVKSVVDDRRQSASYYMPFATSVEDLRNQIIERLPAGSPVPSTSWIRLNFEPNNPNTRSALNYTGQSPVKYAVQQSFTHTAHCMFSKFNNFVPIDLKNGTPINWTYTMYLAKQCIDQNT